MMMNPIPDTDKVLSLIIQKECELNSSTSIESTESTVIHKILHRAKELLLTKGKVLITPKESTGSAPTAKGQLIPWTHVS